MTGAHYRRSGSMSLFIGSLAFADAALLDEAKIGIIAASALSGAAGALVLLRRRNAKQ